MKITIPCEYKISKKCTGERIIWERYLSILKHRACKKCVTTISARNNALTAKKPKDQPQKEIKKLLCDHYGECLTAAALVDRRIIGCNDCDREAYTPKQTDVMVYADIDTSTISPDIRRVVSGG